MKNLIITILVILVLGLGGFILYDKVLKEDNTVKTKENEQIQDETITKNEEFNADLAYKNYIEKLKNDRNNTDSKDFWLNSKTDDLPNGYLFSIKPSGELYFDLFENEITTTEFNNYKIDSKVVNAFLINEGQADWENLYYIKEDNKLYKISIAELIQNGKPTIKSIDKKNIIEIKNTSFYGDLSGSHGPTFIDIEGNISY